LYFRISTFKLRVPALRDRPGDIMPLVAQLLVRHAKDESFTVSAQAQSMLLGYGWPGNVRELENVVQRAVVLCADGHIDTCHLMFDDAYDVFDGYDNQTPTQPALAARHETPGANTAFVPEPDLTEVLCDEEITSLMQYPCPTGVGHLHTAVKSNEHQLIMAAIQNTESRIEAARQLGISPRTLRYKLAKLKGGSELPSMALAR
jgi:two-component system response regulator FlrC